MAFTAEELQGFHNLVDAMGSFKNRNSRVIGTQFNDLPDADANPEFYETVTVPRSLNMVRDALRHNRYTSASEIYWDILHTFIAVRETANRSSVTFRDAVKMEGLLEEVWEQMAKPEVQEYRLPPLETVDSLIRFGNEDEDGRHPSTAVTYGPPGFTTNHLHPTFQPPQPKGTTKAVAPAAVPHLPSAPPSSAARKAPSPALATGVPVRNLQQQHQQQQPATPVASPHQHAPSPLQQYPSNPQLQHQQSGYASQPFNPFRQPNPSGKDGINVPVFIPASVTSRDSRQRLQKQQQRVLATRATALAPKKRKRASDEPTDAQSGWLEGKGDGHSQKLFLLEVIARLKAAVDPASGRSLSASIFGMPQREKFPQFYQCIKDPHPPTLQSIEKHLRTNKVPDPADFDGELVTIFRNARTWQTAGTSSTDGEQLPTFYGDVLGAQRIYQELTKGKGAVPPEPYALPELCGLPFGPGHVPIEVDEDDDGKKEYRLDLPPHRVRLGEKTYLASLNFKGEELSPGTFVHLYNPSNPKLPIIAQIFSCFRRATPPDGDASAEQRYITVNWYYRPSQTEHVAERTFLEQEVFKTSLFVDHPVEDFLERVSVMHVDDYARGRWSEDFPGDEDGSDGDDAVPVYVVEHRYKIETRLFSKIKNWKVCVPEGTLPDPASLRLFTPPAPLPHRIKSPFMRNPNVAGPGRLADPLEQEGIEQDLCYAPLDSWEPGTGQVYGYGKAMAARKLADALPELDSEEENDDHDAEKSGKKGRAGRSASAMQANEPPSDKYFSRETYEPTTQAESVAIQETFESLPEEIASQFRRDPDTGDLLWFTAPPLGDAKSSTKPASSLAYLGHMARSLGY